MEEALKVIEDDKIPIVVAPTSYGKTRATPYIQEYVRKKGLARGVIHVSPLRALVEKVFRDVFEEKGGIQAYGIRGDEKSPYLLKSPMAVTLDSFILSLYRFPIPEIIKIEKHTSAGHFYPVSSAIKSSLVIFDEAHLALESNEKTGYEAFMAGVSALARMGVRFMIETATLRPNVIGELVREMKKVKTEVLLLGEEGNSYVKKLREAVGNRAEIKVMKDSDFEKEYKIKWHTKIDNVINYDEIKKLAEEKLVLVVLNTVPKAQEVYHELRNRGVSNIVLIHGKLATSDRENALRKIGKSENAMKTGVIVTTQVIEAGVDANASIIYTEASPLESLIQRIGRICRRDEVLKECKSNEGDKVIIINDGNYGPYDKDLVLMDLSLIHENIDWRIPYGVNNYTDLLANAKERALSSDKPLQNVYENYLTSDTPPYLLLDILEKKDICSIYGDLAPIFLYVEGLGTINVSLSEIARKDSWVWNVIEYGNTNKPLLIILDEKGNEVAKGEATVLNRENYDNCKYLKKYVIEKEIERMLPYSDRNRYYIALKVKRYERGVGPIAEA